LASGLVFDLLSLVGLQKKCIALFRFSELFPVLSDQARFLLGLALCALAVLANGVVGLKAGSGFPTAITLGLFKSFDSSKTFSAAFAFLLSFFFAFDILLFLNTALNLPTLLIFYPETIYQAIVIPTSFINENHPDRNGRRMKVRRLP